MAAPSPSLADWIADRLPEREGRKPFVLGIAGAQGCGKSTVARDLAARFACPLLSLDDLYLDRAARAALAANVHPLLRTRGVPGTHDPARGLALIEALAQPGTVTLPRFDKGRDEPGTPELWRGPADMLILEGWCLGVPPQSEAALAEPVNALERESDACGVWRRWVNASLAAYRPLFERIDMMVFLAAPGFSVVRRWRAEQEHALKRSLGAGAGMTDAEIAIFVQHYQRLTEHALRSATAWADFVVQLDADRQVT